MASRNRRIKLGGTKAEVHSYDELMEGGIFLVEVHIVQKGETLWKIARHFGISFDELKRVNAHLANPDYIVPGMKIFLPEKSAGVGKGMEKKPSKGAEVVKKTEKEPVKKTEKEPVKVAPPPVKKVEVPAQSKPKPKPAPTPEKPKAPVIPERPVVPKVPEVTTKPMPQIPPMHPMPPMQPMQPQMPFVGVPCGWMPIFDADCFPFVQPGHMQQPIPMPAPQLPVELESSVHINVKPMPKPMPPSVEHTMPDGWKLLESPELQFEEEEVVFKKPTEVHFEESPILKVEEQVEERIEEIPTPSPPRFQMPIAQESPMQGGWQFGQHGQHGGYAAYPQAGCGCGQGQVQPYPQMNPCGSCGQYHPTPQPVQHSNHCNACNQPIQAMPRQMMPYPTQNTNWPGTY